MSRFTKLDVIILKRIVYRLKQKDYKSYLGGDSTWTLKNLKKQELHGNIRTWDYSLSKKGSSRIFHKKDFYRNGISFSIITERDSLTLPDSFENSFFDTFSPADTLKGINPFVKKSNYFFEDFFSADSVAHKRAVNNAEEIELAASDFPQLKKR